MFRPGSSFPPADILQLGRGRSECSSVIRSASRRPAGGGAGAVLVGRGARRCRLPRSLRKRRRQAGRDGGRERVGRSLFAEGRGPRHRREPGATRCTTANSVRRCREGRCQPSHRRGRAGRRRRTAGGPRRTAGRTCSRISGSACWRNCRPSTARWATWPAAVGLRNARGSPRTHPRTVESIRRRLRRRNRRVAAAAPARAYFRGYRLDAG